MPNLKLFHFLAVMVIIVNQWTPFATQGEEYVQVEQAHEFVETDNAIDRDLGMYVANRTQKCRNLLQKVRDQLGIQGIYLNRNPAPEPEANYDVYFSAVEYEEAQPVVGFICKATYDFLVQVLVAVTNVYVRGIPVLPLQGAPEPYIPIKHHQYEVRYWGA